MVRQSLRDERRRIVTNYDLDQDAQETAWAYRLGFDSAAAYHQAADEAFETQVDELRLFDGNAE